MSAASLTRLRGGQHVGPALERLLLQVVERSTVCLVEGEIADELEVVGDGFESHQLSQVRLGLHEADFGGRDVLLELQLLQRDLVELALRQIAGLHALPVDLDDLGKALEVLLREIQRRLGEQRRDECLLRLEAQLALLVDTLIRVTSVVSCATLVRLSRLPPRSKV